MIKEHKALTVSVVALVALAGFGLINRYRRKGFLG
ncbi:hypothetical protein BJ964_008323 [Actinoplanes lobatus]|uniref:LPXTG cell wall anchor domain-containing protein n=1 Tax=Actinoplanes lobatus TaxID=113568 RepID=A0A7W7HPM5_9ACTN|nr:hypothetical protein [Actinoplanes lobatus]